MAELLGLGMTHFPPLAGFDERMAGILKGTLRDPDIPEHHEAGLVVKLESDGPGL